MLPLNEPEKFDIPPYLSLSSNTAQMLPSSNNAQVLPSSTSTTAPSAELTGQTSDSLITIPNASLAQNTITTKDSVELYYQPISSITPAKLKIDSDESVLGPKLGVGKDGV